MTIQFPCFLLPLNNAIILEAILPNSVAKEVYADASACQTFYPNGTITIGDIPGALPTRETFDLDLPDMLANNVARAYWSVVFANCGEDWMKETVIDGGEDDTAANLPKSGPATLDASPASSSSAIGTVLVGTHLIGLLGFAVLIAI